MGRRAVLLLAAVVLVLGCSGDDDSKEEVTDRLGGVDYEEVASDLDACVQTMESGDPMSAEDVEACRSAAGAASRDCDDGSVLTWVTIDDRTWLIRDGEPAEAVVEMDPTACP